MDANNRGNEAIGPPRTGYAAEYDGGRSISSSRPPVQSLALTCNKCKKPLATTFFYCACDCIFCVDCTFSHFKHSSSCPTCRKQLGENDFTELVVADNYEALTNENTRLKQQQTSLRLQYKQNLNDMQNKLMAKERTITEQNHVINKFQKIHGARVGGGGSGIGGVPHMVPHCSNASLASRNSESPRPTQMNMEGEVDNDNDNEYQRKNHDGDDMTTMTSGNNSDEDEEEGLSTRKKKEAETEVSQVNWVHSNGDNGKKSIVCKYFSRNTCRNGDECPYSHENKVIKEKCKTRRGGRGKPSTLKRDVVRSNSQSNGGGGSRRG